MIEFKADCGHTLQLPDREAGKVVKCAYCGREVEAPSGDEHDPDFLFQEVDISELAKGEGPGGSGALTIKGRQKRAKAAPSEEQVVERGNTAMRLTMVAGFTVVCVLVLLLVLRSMMNIAEPNIPGRPSATAATPPVLLPPARQSTLDPAPPRPSSDMPPPAAVASGRRGYTFGSDSNGIVVETVAQSARIYLRGADSQNPEILGIDETERRGTGATRLEVPPGNYILAVAMMLSDSDLGDLPGFQALRSQLELGGDAGDADDYFAPDCARALVFIDELDMEPRLVRYYDVGVRPRHWSLVASWFIPGQTPADLLNHAPSDRHYGFAHDEVRRQMARIGVPAGVHSTLVDLLERLGQVVYVAADGARCVLEIDPQTGVFASRVAAAPPLEAPQDSSPVVDNGSGQQPPPRPRIANPWEHPRTPPRTRAQEDNLGAVLSRFEQHPEDRTPAVWGRYLAGGSDYRLWQKAAAAERVAFARGIDADAASQLIDPLGETLLGDPDLAVRLAVLSVLLETADRQVIAIIDSRLEALDQDDTASPQDADSERNALLEARRQLTRPAGPPKNPWER